MFQTHISPEYLTSDVISNGVVHCFSTRRGGVSTGCLASLNLGTHRGDDWNHVYENYRRLGSAVGFTPEQTVFTRQTHTDIVARVGAAERGDGLFREVEPERDGICTNEPGVALVCCGRRTRGLARHGKGNRRPLRGADDTGIRHRPCRPAGGHRTLHRPLLF